MIWELTGKKVWDLSISEIDYIYSKLHMNNYVYAALNIFHESNPPLNKQVKINEDNIPEFLSSPIRNFIKISPYLGNYDPKIVREHYTFNAFNLFRSFKYIDSQNISQVIKILSTLAYISIIADKNDNLLVWKHPVIRQRTALIENIFNEIIRDADIKEILKMPLHKESPLVEIGNSCTNLLYNYIPKVVTVIIIMIENGIDKKVVANAFNNIEKRMIEYEESFFKNDKLTNEKSIFIRQLRYKNTLYLYGGHLFEKIGLIDNAISWYLKGLLFDELPNLLDFYLTALKTCERLLMGYRISHKSQKFYIKDLIDKCLLRAFKKGSEYSQLVFEFIANNNHLDLSKEKLIDNKNNNEWLYGGEAAREIFLISILYQNIIYKVSYSDIDYKEFIKVVE